MTEALPRLRKSRRILLVALWVTLLVLAVKVWTGLATGTLSLLGDSLHTLIDGFCMVLSLVAIAPPEHTDGRSIWSHSKRESLLVLLFVAFLGFACFSLVGLSVHQLSAMLQRTPLPLTIRLNLSLIQLLSGMVALNLGLGFFQRYRAKTLDSLALRLNSTQLLRDAWLTILVLIGLVGIWYGYLWLDPVLAILMGLTTAGSCWRVLNWQLPSLLQQMAIAPEAIARTVRQVEGITHCYGIRSHGIVGRQVLIELHLIVHPEYLESLATLTKRLECLLQEQYGPTKVTIYLDGDRLDSPPASSMPFKHPFDSSELDLN